MTSATSAAAPGAEAAPLSFSSKSEDPAPSRAAAPLAAPATADGSISELMTLIEEIVRAARADEGGVQQDIQELKEELADRTEDLQVRVFLSYPTNSL